MSTIDFVARDGAGTLDEGTFSGASNNTFFASSGQDISLNLQRSSVISYMRSGQALQITLVDGQVLTIEGFFSPDGTAVNRLFLSASGQLAEVELLSGDGNLLLAQYSDAESFGKWSPDDALYFTDNGALAIAGVSNDGVEATMLGVPLLSSLGGIGGVGAGVAAAGGALLLSGTSGAVLDTTTNVTFDASTVETDGIVNFVEESDGVVLTGTTEAGASVVVSFAGASYEASVSGTTWTLDVDADVLAQGEYDLEIAVKATDQHGNTASTTDTLHIDTVTSLTIDTSKPGVTAPSTTRSIQRASTSTVLPKRMRLWSSRWGPTHIPYRPMAKASGKRRSRAMRCPPASIPRW